MEPKFKVGDRVKIKDLTYYEDDYNIGITDSMIKSAGIVMTICSAENDWFDIATYRLREDIRCWCWAEDMLEPYIEDKPCKFMKRK